MAWSGGTEIMSIIISTLQDKMPHDERVAFYLEAIPAFMNADWDEADYLIGEDEAFDEALEQIDPSYFEEIDVEDEEA